MNLLPHQYEFINDIFKNMENLNYIIVTGESGCGKSYAFQWAAENIEKLGFETTIFLDNDFLTDDQDYFPFKRAVYFKENRPVQYVKQGAIEAAKDTPLVGNFVSYLVSSFLKDDPKIDSFLFNEEEQLLINHIKKKLHNKKSCIICDNIHWWDRRSLNLLINILDSNILSKNVKFIISITNNQKNQNEDIINNLLTRTSSNYLIKFPKFSYLDFKKHLYIETQKKLSENQIELLYNLVDCHLKVFFEVINEIKKNSFDFNSNFQSNKKYLSDLLNRRLKECGATGEQIIDVLEYASVIGIGFSEFELHRLTDYTRSRIKKIIKHTDELKLTENSVQIDEYRFAHDIIREIFKSRVDENHIEYYHKMSLCLKEIKPGQYFRRAKYMLLSFHDDKAEILFCLEMVAQLRKYGNISNAIWEDAKGIINAVHYDYINYMTLAYTAYHKKEYDIALNNLNLILSYYSNELLAERDILKLRCFSKTLATDEISSEVEKLDKKRSNWSIDNEKEIYERYTHALITAYAHLGEISKARELEEDVLVSLADRIDFDENARQRLHIIKRNANAIHGVETASIFVKQAVDYFENQDATKNDRHFDIKQYYSSLINYSALLIKQGDFSRAFDETIKALKLEQDNKDFSFPRTQILRNNCILSGVLDNKIIPSTAIELYNNMIEQLPGTLAEKLFYTSNLSIMYALNNEIDMAFYLLKNESMKHNIAYDKEGIYRYRVETNCAIYEYLLGRKEPAITTLKQQENYLQRLINGSFFIKRRNLIIEIMNESKVFDGLAWLSSVQLKCPEFQGKPWRYFGKGYAFAALCDWGI